MIISFVFAIALLAALGFLALSRRQRSTLLASRPASAGALASVRRVFLYLVAAVGLVAACNGVVWLLQTMLRQLIPSLAAGPAVGLPDESTLALGLALSLAGLPTWALAWRAAQMRLRQDSLEALYLSRRLYLGLVTVAATVVAMVSGSELFRALFGSDEARFVVIATVGVWGALAWWQRRSARGELQAETSALAARSLARSLDGLFMHLLWLVGLLFLALGSALALTQGLAAVYASLFAPAGALSLAPWWNEGMRSALASALAGGLAWLWVTRQVRVGAPASLIRRVALVFGATLPAAVALFAAAGVAAYQLLQWWFGVHANVTAYERFAPFPGVIASAVVGGGVWALVAELLAREGARARPDDSRAQRAVAQLRRWQWLVLTILGLGALATGVGFLLSTLFGLIPATPTATLRGIAWRDPFLVALSLL
jgi:hypothetical protein